MHYYVEPVALRSKHLTFRVNSILLYLYSAKTIQLSQSALQSPVPEPP